MWMHTKNGKISKLNRKGDFIMAVNVRQLLVSGSKYNIKCPYQMVADTITVHNTYNDATAENEVKYMIGNNNQVSFHIAVDDKEDRKSVV